MINKKDSLGIPNYGKWYLEILPEQDISEEFFGIQNFINSVCRSKTVPEFQGRDKRIQFINYGRTQLVFVLTIDEKRQYTFLVNQPATEAGTGKIEFQNLKSLNKNNPQNVINPLYYFADRNNPNRELYITNYHYQSRCIGIESKDWGMWVPEPDYHFTEFSDDERNIINTSMVAMLVKLYDDKRKCGLSKVRLDGGDFMIEKGFEEDFSQKNVLEKIKLIAARKLVPMEFDEYIDRMKFELLGQEVEQEDRLIIGKKLRCPFSIEEINKGVQLGLELRKEQAKTK